MERVVNIHLDNHERSALKSSFDAIFIILLLCSIMGLGYLIFSYLQSYSYAFPRIRSIEEFFYKTVLNISLPFLTLCVCFFYAKRRRKVLFALTYTLAVILLVCGFFRSSSEILLTPTVCSYTTAPADFGTFDPKIQQNIPEFAFFPASVPEASSNVQYLYYFEEAGADTAYIALSFVYENDNDFNEIISSLQHVSPSENPLGETVYDFTGSIADSTAVRPYLYSVIILDKTDKAAAFVATTSAELLPQCLAEVFDCPFSL